MWHNEIALTPHAGGFHDQRPRSEFSIVGPCRHKLHTCLPLDLFNRLPHSILRTRQWLAPLQAPRLPPGEGDVNGMGPSRRFSACVLPRSGVGPQALEDTARLLIACVRFQLWPAMLLRLRVGCELTAKKPGTAGERLLGCKSCKPEVASRGVLTKPLHTIC